MGARALILWSDKPGVSSFRSLKPGDDMVVAGDVVRKVQSLPALVSTLDGLRKQLPQSRPSRQVVVPGAPAPPDDPPDPQALREAQFHSLIFNTHGSPGILNLGGDEVTPNQIKSELGGKGFENLLTPNATVTFEGCNIAEGPSGELFLARVGEVFLKSGGGDVKGNTGMGVAVPIIGSTKGFHPMGEWITARVGAGGTVTIINPKHLSMKLINKRLESAEARLTTIEQQKLADAKAIAIMKIELKNARKYVGGSSVALSDMSNTCDELDALEADLDKYRGWTLPHT